MIAFERKKKVGYCEIILVFYPLFHETLNNYRNILYQKTLNTHKIVFRTENIAILHLFSFKSYDILQKKEQLIEKSQKNAIMRERYIP